MSPTTEIYCRIVHETPAAYLIDAGTGENVWIPKSQVSGVSEPGKTGHVEITMSEYIAAEKELI